MSHPAIGATVEVRRGTRAPGAATLTGRARLMAVMDGQAIDRTIAFLDVHGCRMSAPMQRDAQGWHVHQHELEAVRPRAPRWPVRKLSVDSFAGGGGASRGISWAFGRGPDIAINHDAEAIALHPANHPESRHYCEDARRSRRCGRTSSSLSRRGRGEGAALVVDSTFVCRVRIRWRGPDSAALLMPDGDEKHAGVVMIETPAFRSWQRDSANRARRLSPSALQPSSAGD